MHAKKVENMKIEYKKHDFQKFLALNMNKSPWRIRTRDLRFTKPMRYLLSYEVRQSYWSKQTLSQAI